jgi:hypothetical protein
MDCPYHSQPRVQGTMEAKGMTLDLHTNTRSVMRILMSDSNFFFLPENQEPELPG